MQNYRYIETRLYLTLVNSHTFYQVLWEMFSMGAPPSLPGCQGFFAPGAGEVRHREDLTEW